MLRSIGLPLMRMYVFGDPNELFAEPQAEVSRVSGESQLLELLATRDVFIVAHARDLLRIGAPAAAALPASVAALLVLGGAEDVTPALQAFPSLPAVLAAPISNLALDRGRRFAQQMAGRKKEVSALEGELARRNADLSELNKIGAALSAERDINRLLSLILDKSRQITSADAGSLYLVMRGEASGQPDSLRFALAKNDSVPIAFQESRMPLDETSIAGYVAVQGAPVNVADAYTLPAGDALPHLHVLRCEVRLPHEVDAGGAHARPSERDHRGHSTHQQEDGCRRPSCARVEPVDGLVVSFDDLDLELVMSLASQAAVALVNTRLIEDIKALFESFVQASVTAIESRDPTTSGHSGRVAELTVGLAEKVDGSSTGIFAPLRFSRDQIQEIKYASLLHDFGKVGVREKVLVKAKKLYFGEMLTLRQRFGLIKKNHGGGVPAGQGGLPRSLGKSRRAEIARSGPSAPPG